MVMLPPSVCWRVPITLAQLTILFDQPANSAKQKANHSQKQILKADIKEIPQPSRQLGASLSFGWCVFSQASKSPNTFSFSGSLNNS